jgi:hypothetical protein
MSNGELVHVYYFPGAGSVQEFQDLYTTIRSISNLRWVGSYPAARAFVARAIPEKIELTDWLVRQFEKPANAQAGSREYRVKQAAKLYLAKGAPDELVHVYFLKHVEDPQDLEELANIVRSLGKIGWVRSTIGPPMSIMTRGSADQMALGDWLLQKLDQPTSGAAPAESEASQEFPASSPGDSVRVFYLRNATIAAFQSVAAEVRAAGVPKVLTYSALGALVVRGTGDQTAAAQNLINSRLEAQR